MLAESSATTIQFLNNKSLGNSTELNFQYQDLWSAARNIAREVFGLKNINQINLLDVHSGSFNVIFRFQILEKQYVFRVRQIESDFAFENIPKEPFAVLALESDNYSDRELRDTMDVLLQKKRSGFMKHPLIGEVYWSDWSKKLSQLPYVCSIYKWEQGEPLYSVPTPKNFESAGKFLAKLHRKRFLSCYKSIFEIGNISCSLQESILLVAKQQSKKALENKGSLSLIYDILAWINKSVENLQDQYDAVFCHYDFSGSNIIVEKASHNISVIDFDNWKVSVREEDFPKLLHWTVIDSKTQKRVSSPSLINDFVRGYERAGGLINERVLRLKEAEWLLRVYSHSLYRENLDIESYRKSSFPCSEYYEQAILSLLKST